MSDKLEKVKKDANYPRNEKLNPGLPTIPSTVNIGDFEDNIQKIEKYININKQDVNDIKVDIKEINEKTIPEIYRYINEKCKGRIDSQELYKNKINQIKLNNSNNSNNFNNIYNKNPININNNNNINQITESDYKVTISNGNLNNNSNNNIVANKNVNIEDLAGQIESMGVGIDYGINNNKNNINKNKNDSYQDKNSFFNNSISINDKSNSKKNDFDFDFDS